MAAGGGTQSGRFHLKCSSAVHLSDDGVIAWTTGANAFGMVFSKEPIPTGHKFSVKVLKPAVVSSTWFPFLGIGLTTKGPSSGPVLSNLDDFKKADQYWYVKIDIPAWAAQYKGQQGRLPWTLASSEGKTAGCWVSDKGTFYSYTRESDSGDEMGEGLPTGRPLWGFVAIRGEWKVEANYKVAISKGEAVVHGRLQLTAPAVRPNSSSPAVQPRPKAPAGHPQDYAGKTFHFVEKPPKWLVCAVCQALAHVPVQAKCCGKIYCSRCIERWKTRSNSCPTCRRTELSEPPFNVSEDKNARQQIISLTVYCPKWKEGCDKKMELSEVESHFTSNNCFLFQPVECEYKWFGCAKVVPRKDMAEHLKKSVEAHLQMTKRRVEEMEVRLQEERQLLEVQLRKMEEMAKKHETGLKDVEESAERERRRLKEAIACNVEQMEKRAKMHETRLKDVEESKLMKEKLHRSTTLMRWLLICVPVLLLVATVIGYHQGLLPPITAIILSYLLGLFSLIHYHVL